VTFALIEQLGVLDLLRLAARRRPIRVMREISPAARVLIRCLKAVRFPLDVAEIEYDFLDDVQLPSGGPILDEWYFQAPGRLFREIETEPWYARAVEESAGRPSHAGYIHAYLSKRIFWELFERMRPVLVAQWWIRREGGPDAELYLPQDWMLKYLRAYAAQWGLKVEGTPPRSAGFRIPPAAADLAQKIVGRLLALGSNPGPDPGSAGTRVAVEMYMNGIRPKGVFNTDFFWYRPEDFRGGSVFAYFRQPQDQPTAERKGLLKEQGIGWMDRMQVMRAMFAPIRMEKRRPPRDRTALSGTLDDFYREYERWVRFFRATRARVHVSTADHSPESEALHAAMEDVGGVSLSIQRSIERAHILRRSAVDVHLAFSREGAAAERAAGSSVRQFVVAGYLFDGLFPNAGEFAAGLRERLRAQGVKFTLCLLDENDGILPKRFGGVRHFRESYEFLCDRLREDPTLGLILKPKRAESLRRRLGPTWERIEEALRSERCILLSGRPPDERYLPSAGAAAADLSINFLKGGTAGLESVLAGTPCLLMRRVKEDLGPYRDLPEGTVVFDSWPGLWQAVQKFRSQPNPSSIGDWGPVLDQLVSMRDGRASERIGRYIAWLHQAFERGMNREEALRFAWEQYCGLWGDDLTFEILQPFEELVAS